MTRTRHLRQVKIHTAHERAAHMPIYEVVTDAHPTADDVYITAVYAIRGKARSVAASAGNPLVFYAKGQDDAIQQFQQVQRDLCFALADL